MEVIKLILLTLWIVSCNSEAEKPTSFTSYDQYGKWVEKTYKAETVKPESSYIHKMKYYPEGLYMKIYFNSNKSKGYLYKNVSSSLWSDFKNADSKGKFYHKRIKNDKSIKIKL